jgi:hypothetical protein
MKTEALKRFKNPFRPGAGHQPPYLAGRLEEQTEFGRLLEQSTILENMVLTGLRGVGKTVLLERLKPTAIAEGWLWVGTDLSESMSMSEEHLAIRLLTDLSVVTSGITIKKDHAPKYFQLTSTKSDTPLTFAVLMQIYTNTPGLVADKLKGVLEFCWEAISRLNKRGVIFAYDEAQNLADHAAKEQFPLSLLLDVFQSLQRKGIRFMLVLSGLPTLFPKLVEARTYAERMFRVVFLKALNRSDTKDAVSRPITDAKDCPFVLADSSVTTIWEITRGYPYFIQYVCKETFDVWVQAVDDGRDPTPIPVQAIMKKLDSDFFAGRWSRATDRQRELLYVISSLDNAGGEFSVQEIVEQSQAVSTRPFGASQVNQMLVALGENGLIYKNRHGKYSFAVPLLGQFILRQRAEAEDDV